MAGLRRGEEAAYVRHQARQPSKKVRSKNAKIVQRRKIGYAKKDKGIVKAKGVRKANAPRPMSAAQFVSRRRPYGCYSILGLKPPSTRDEIRAAARDMLNKYRADLADLGMRRDSRDAAPDEVTSQKLSALRTATELILQASRVLKDPKEKEAYDQQLCISPAAVQEARRLPSAVSVAAWRRKQTVNDKAEDAVVNVYRMKPEPRMTTLREKLPEKEQALRPIFGKLVRYPERIRGAWKLCTGMWTRKCGRSLKLSIIERSSSTMGEYRRFRSVLVCVRESWLIGLP